MTLPVEPPVAKAACTTDNQTRVYFAQVRTRFNCEALVVAPGKSSRSDRSSDNADQSPGWAGQLSFDRELRLEPSPDMGPLAFKLTGATGADCVLCSCDHSAGLMQHLGLTAVLVVVGIARGPALSSGVKGCLLAPAD